MSLNRATDLLFSNPGLFCRKSVARLLPRAPFFPRRAVRNIRGVRFECEFALDPPFYTVEFDFVLKKVGLT